ncbi:MAG: alpha/beta hydrolase [Alphaproteobacteria bacterium]|nr:MAG: alpha/beta hydrolase [Alphaproteobacteria bacterium]
MTSEQVTLRGRPFHLLRAGDPDAPPLLMLHGFPEYSGAWAEVAAELAGRFHVVAPDQRGYGRSWAPPEVEAYVLSELVADMAALIDRLGGRVCVVGHDWGAAVAYGLAMFTPERVARLVILNGVHPVPFQRALLAGGAQTEASQYIRRLREPGSEEWLARDGFAPLARLFAANMDTGWLSGARLEAYRREWARPGRLRGMVNWYRASPLVVPEAGKPPPEPPRLPPPERLRVPMPHLLIWGEQDRALLPESFAGLEEFAPQLTVERLPDADHWLHHQKPGEVAELIAAFASGG